MYNILNSEFVKYDYDSWIRYFRYNSGQRLRIDFSGETELSSEQRKRIFPSITAFQKGERSEGRYFQSYTLAHFHNTVWTGFCRRALMTAACLAVWTAYRSVFRSGGYSLHKFLQNSLLLLHQSAVIVRKGISRQM